jgi:hypothetical protein
MTGLNFPLTATGRTFRDNEAIRLYRLKYLGPVPLTETERQQVDKETLLEFELIDGKREVKIDRRRTL